MKSKRINIYLTKNEKVALKYLAKEHYKMPMSKTLLYLIGMEYINNANMEIQNIIKINEFKV